MGAAAGKVTGAFFEGEWHDQAERAIGGGGRGVLCAMGAWWGSVNVQGQATPVPATKPAEKEKIAIYDEKADGRELIKAALARAKKENHSVLIQWGGNWCGWCVALHKLYEKDAAISKELMYDYELVMVDTNARNVPIAKDYNATLAGVPYLTVLDADGKVLANQETDSLEVKDASGKSVGVDAGHVPAKVLAFLKEHAPKPWVAQEVLDKGLAEAKASNKVAFVHFGAPWCGWCKRLEAWMDQPTIKPILAKDFVDIKIDEDRMTGGKEMAEKMGATGGIPWYAVVDGSGKTLGTSTMDGGASNIGYPASAAEIEQFMALLKKSTHHASASDLSVLRASLEDAGKKLGH